MSDTMTTERDDRAAIDKAFSLLTCFGEQAASGVGVSELARRASLSKSTAFRVLQLLERNGVVERIGRPTGSVSACTTSARRSTRRSRTGSVKCSHRSSRTCTSSRTRLFTLRPCTAPMSSTWPSSTVTDVSPHRHGWAAQSPAHCTAIGKALIAHDPSTFDLITSHSQLQRLTDNSIVDAEDLSLQLHRIRRDGIALELEECAPGLALRCRSGLRGGEPGGRRPFRLRAGRRLRPPRPRGRASEGEPPGFPGSEACWRRCDDPFPPVPRLLTDRRGGDQRHRLDAILPRVSHRQD